MPQMIWMPKAGANTDSEKILHLRISPAVPWKPYTSFPELKKSDYQFLSGFFCGNSPQHSKGFSTMQSLLRDGWELLPSPQGQGEDNG